MNEAQTTSAHTGELLALIQAHPVYFVLTLAMLLASALYLISKFKITWNGWLPTFHSRDELRDKEQIERLKGNVSVLEDKLKSYRRIDFFEKTDNGNYVGFSVAKKPYVEIWADGNWNSQEYHGQLRALEKLWTDEDEVIIYGENPNIPSEIYAIVEAKAKTLPQLTIYCTYQLSRILSAYFTHYDKVKIIVRS